MLKTLSALASSLTLPGEREASGPSRFRADLRDSGVPSDKAATGANGRAGFEVLDDGTAIRYRVDIEGIDDLWTAYVHVAEEPGGNGPAAGRRPTMGSRRGSPAASRPATSLAMPKSCGPWRRWASEG